MVKELTILTRAHYRVPSFVRERVILNTNKGRNPVGKEKIKI